MTIESRLENLQIQLNTVCELLEMSINSLNTKKSVSKFLNRSEKTIDNYIKNETFVKDKHYYINEKDRIVFIPFAIVNFKKNPSHKLSIVKKETKLETIQLSEASSKILKGVL